LHQSYSFNAELESIVSVSVEIGAEILVIINKQITRLITLFFVFTPILHEELIGPEAYKTFQIEENNGNVY
jgi:hypothetical protein